MAGHAPPHDLSSRCVAEGVASPRQKPGAATMCLPGSPITLPLVPDPDRKYDVAPEFALPDLTAALPRGGHLIEHPAVRLRDTYYDTADLRLARGGALLWHRRGGVGPPWIVQLPIPVPRAAAAAPHPVREVSAKGAAGRIPEQLVQLVLSFSRGAPLVATTTLMVDRRADQ